MKDAPRYMMKIFLDTNVLLDVIQEREGVQAVRQLLEIAKAGNDIRLYVSYLSIANAAFVLRSRPADEIKALLKELMNYCNVLPCTDMQIYEGIRGVDCPDFEDGLQIMCAESNHCDLILTSNVRHFYGCTELPVLTAADFVSHCGR